MLLQTSQSPVKIFSKSLESLNLWMGIVGVIAIYALLPFTFHQFSNSDKIIFDMIAYYVFFNGTHSFFTFLMLIRIPEMRGMVMEMQKRGSLWPIVAVVIGLIFFIVHFFLAMGTDHDMRI